jgi:hypothetical protein
MREAIKEPDVNTTDGLFKCTDDGCTKDDWENTADICC